MPYKDDHSGPGRNVKWLAGNDALLSGGVFVPSMCRCGVFTCGQISPMLLLVVSSDSVGSDGDPET
jgi:hypothetical protein